MITNDPNPEEIGKIIEWTKQEESKYKLQEPKPVFGNVPIATLLMQKEREALELFAQQERPALLKEMRSKNKAAQRRAKKKIADASRRRNRK